jgi:hypothetical protein
MERQASRQSSLCESAEQEPGHAHGDRALMQNFAGNLGIDVMTSIDVIFAEATTMLPMSEAIYKRVCGRAT